MSRLRVFREDEPAKPLLATTATPEIAAELEKIGVRFEQWQAGAELEPGAAPDVVLDAYRNDIDRLISEKGFRSVDVVSITPEHPDRETMRKKFLDEHFHKEDEVRFFVDGSGLFTLHVGEMVYEIRCERGDLIGVPDSTLHWFDMGPEPRFIAIRFFTEPDGWVGHFTGSDLAQRFPRHEPDAAA